MRNVSFRIAKRGFRGRQAHGRRSVTAHAPRQARCAAMVFGLEQSSRTVFVVRATSKSFIAERPNGRKLDHETHTSCACRRHRAVEPRLRRHQNWRVDGQVRRQLPDRSAQRHGGLRQDGSWRHASDRGRQGRRLQTTEPGSELHRQRRERHHRQSGRHVRHRGDHQGRRRRRGAARLRQPRADRRRQARAQSRLRRVERGRVGHA